MRTVVTGAAGFIGRRLVARLLDSGHHVRALVRRPPPTPLPRDAQVVPCDVIQPKTLEGQFDGCDRVFHLAGCTLGRSRSEFRSINRDGTIHVANECLRQSTPPRLIYVSSLAAAGPAPEDRAKHESDPSEPVSHYGSSKLAAERALAELAGRIPIQIARPGSVFGSDDRYMLPLFKMAASGWVVVPGLTDRRYSLVHVDDAVDALIRISQAEESVVDQPNSPTEIASGTFFIAQPEPISFPEVARIVAGAVSERRVWKVPIPGVACWCAGAINSAVSRTTPLRPLLNLDKMREAMAGSWMCDTARLRDVAGFDFKVSLSERIRQTAHEYREKGMI